MKLSLALLLWSFSPEVTCLLALLLHHMLQSWRCLPVGRNYLPQTREQDPPVTIDNLELRTSTALHSDALPERGTCRVGGEAVASLAALELQAWRCLPVACGGQAKASGCEEGSGGCHLFKQTRR